MRCYLGRSSRCLASVLLLALAAGCPSPGPSDEGAVPAEAEATRPAPEATPAVEAAGAGVPEPDRVGEEERDDAAGAVAPEAEDPASATEVLVGDFEQFWTVCDDAVEARVRRHVVDDGTTTVEARLEEGWIQRAVAFLNDDSTWEGAWGCRRQGDRVEVAAMSQVEALGVGPRFAYDPGNDTVEATNWLGRVVLAAAPQEVIDAQPSRTRALQRLADCTAPNGVPLTSGLFVALQRMGRFGRADAITGWFVLPDTIRDGEVLEIVSLQRRGSSGPAATSFEVGADSCVPLDDHARSAWEIAASIVRGDRQLVPEGVPLDVPPSRVSGNANRSMAYVLADAGRVATLEDWIAFYRSARPYAPGAWRALGPDSQGRFNVVHTFSLGADRFEAGWVVMPRTGEVAPSSPITALVDAVRPTLGELRVITPEAVVAAVDGSEGSGATGQETLSSAEIDARLAAKQDDVIRCYRYELGRGRQPRSVSATWRVTGEGRAVDIALHVDGPESLSFERCVERLLASTTYPTFDGPPVDARTVFTFPER